MKFYKSNIYTYAFWGLDFTIGLFCFNISSYLVYGQDFQFNKYYLGFSLILNLVFLCLLQLTGAYQVNFRYDGLNFFRSVYKSFFITFIFFIFILTFIGKLNLFLLLIVYALTFANCIFLYRIFISSLFRRLKNNNDSKNFIRNILIYGSGEAGIQLAAAFSGSFEQRVVGFIDDDSELWGKSIDSLPIYGANKLSFAISNHNVQDIWLALPSIDVHRQREILHNLSKFNIQVKSLPTLENLHDGKVTTKDIKSVNVEDLLLRPSIAPDLTLLKKNIEGKVVFVTGAAGSVGSELCRQIISLNPRHLIALDNSEYGLFQIVKQLDSYSNGKEIQITPLLVSIGDNQLIEEIISKWKPHTIYHAAAYKHVPIVEENIVASIRNNIFPIRNLVALSQKYLVESFILISTDKAVRPTSIMGATKRVAEMILQSAANQDACVTCFSMVRFGNVLGSSGSVVPLFQDQIRAGGPITLSHPDITRYFMTIAEASQLVLQAGALAKGGDVFLLDMGTPVKIIDLARKMVDLAGLKMRDKENTNGDIELKIVGLRPGEKLYEEMLIENNALQTQHPRIMRANEEFLDRRLLEQLLSDLEEDLNHVKIENIKMTLQKLVTNYTPDVKNVDRIFM